MSEDYPLFWNGLFVGYKDDGLSNHMPRGVNQSLLFPPGHEKKLFEFSIPTNPLYHTAHAPLRPPSEPLKKFVRPPDEYRGFKPRKNTFFISS